LQVQIWERGYLDHRIRDGNDFEPNREYIRQNPIKAGLASSAEE